MADHGALKVAASNDLFGDPANGIVKKLRIDYTVDGVPRSRMVGRRALYSSSWRGVIETVSAIVA